jgi:hypothetical protein
MNAKRCAAWLCVAACWLAGAEVLAAKPAELTAGQIKAALRTTHIEDAGFTSFVVNLKPWVPGLSKAIVVSFDWARQRDRHPFQYFKKSLTIKAPQVQRELNAAAKLDANQIKQDLGLKQDATADRAFVDTTVRLAKAGTLAPTMVSDAHASAKSAFWRKFAKFKSAVETAAQEHGVKIE